jgi:type II secretion system protein N
MAAKKRRFTWRSVGKGLGYFFFFLVVTFLFTYATLPFEKIKARYLRVAEDKLGMDIVGKIEKSWFTGIRGENLRFISRPKPGEKPQEMVMDEVSVRLAVLPLFLGRLKINFAAKLADGEIEGSFTRKSDGNEVEAALKGLDLKAVTLLQKLFGRSVEGSASGTVNLFLARNLAASTGKVELDVAGTRVASFQVPIAQWGNQPFTVPDLSLGDLRAEIDVEEGSAVFKEFKFKDSRDLEASVQGYAVLQETLARTNLRAYLKFRFSDGFFQRNPKFRVMDGVADMQQAKAPDGFFGFLLEGPIGMPALLRRTPSPQPPPNLTPPKPTATPAAGPIPPRPMPPRAMPPRPGPQRPPAGGRPDLGDLREKLMK